MGPKILAFLISSMLLFFSVINIFAQQKIGNAIGIGGGPTYTGMEGKGRWGLQTVIQWNVHLGKSWFLDTHGGMDEIFYERYPLDEGTYWSKRHLYKVGLGPRYYLSEGFSAKAGLDVALVNFSSDTYARLYPTIGLAYDVPMGGPHTLEIGGRADFFGVDFQEGETYLITGLSFSYKWWYRK